MKITIKWLKEYVDFPSTVEELAHELTMCGLEVEEINRLPDDVVLDINVTPNRPDCLSLFGIAREVATIYGTPLRFPEHNFIAENEELDFNVDILNTDLCHRYAGRIIKGVKIAPSPEWMQRRLQNCGIRAINNVVDITNYVLLELGHPLHAFDLHRLRGKRIIVATAREVNAQKIPLLDGSERELEGDMLLINDAERPVALAGIMGGLDSEVTDETRDLFIESAWFLPASIRKTSRRLGIQTESSYRFERGADIKLLKKALDRAAYLAHHIAGGVICGKIDIYPRRYHSPTIRLSYHKINSFLGMEIPKKDVLRILSALGLEVEVLEEDLIVRPSSARMDIQRDVDVIEEVVRMYGYDKVPSVIPEAPIKLYSDDPPSKKINVSEPCRSLLIHQGFNEAINYSFIGPADLDMLCLDSIDIRRRAINILNPLRQEDAMMRTTLVPSLLRNLVHNLSYGNRDIRLFEIARVFIKTGDSKLPTEHKHLALLMAEDREKAFYKEETEDFFILKGVVESLIDHIGIGKYNFVRSSEPFLHPGKSADIVLADGHLEAHFMLPPKEQGFKIGFVGVVSPQVIDSLPIKITRQQVLLAELSLEALTNAASVEKTCFSPIPQYPYIERDTALVVDESLQYGRFLELLRSCCSELVEDCYIFDIYRGKGIPEGKKGIAFNVRYRSPERTLSDQEVEELHGALIRDLLSKTGGSLRN
jgi:phenylalanyl-tRNA synthetase beta chain